jgi:hypothetical protein
VEVADPDFAFAGAVDFLDPAFGGLDSWQATTDALDLEFGRRYEG